MPLDYKGLMETFDQYGKAPRPVQVSFCKELVHVWDKYKVHVGMAPVAVGKSLLMRAIQQQTDAAIIAGENTLVDQYAASFADINALKGKARYSCMIGGTCEQTAAARAGKCCGGCPYTSARSRAKLGEDTVYNPMSYLINVARDVIEAAPVLLIDEAHKLAGFLRMLGTVEIPEGQTTMAPEEMADPVKLLAYAEVRYANLGKLIEKKAAKRAQTRLAKDIGPDVYHDFADGIEDDTAMRDKMYMVIKALKHGAGNYVVHSRPGKRGSTLVIEPITPPQYYIDILLRSDKIVLVSGTMAPHHIKDLVGGLPYSYMELPTPIPAGNRMIKIEPCAPELNHATPPQVVAKKIKQILERHEGKKGIIHATYRLANDLKTMLPAHVLCHDKYSKAEVLAQFKETPGTWLLASGMAEGIDLSGDLARVNIITKLQWPNLNDPFVIKRKSLKDGKLWFLSTTLEHLIQAAGRTTRGVDDKSITYCLDPGLDRLIRQLKDLTKHDRSLQQQYLPSSFLEALRY